jgi:hypothetical protein
MKRADLAKCLSDRLISENPNLSKLLSQSSCDDHLREAKKCNHKSDSSSGSSPKKHDSDDFRDVRCHNSESPELLLSPNPADTICSAAPISPRRRKKMCDSIYTRSTSRRYDPNMVGEWQISPFNHFDLLPVRNCDGRIITRIKYINIIQKNVFGEDITISIDLRALKNYVHVIPEPMNVYEMSVAEEQFRHLQKRLYKFLGRSEIPQLPEERRVIEQHMKSIEICYPFLDIAGIRDRPPLCSLYDLVYIANNMILPEDVKTRINRAIENVFGYPPDLNVSEEDIGMFINYILTLSTRIPRKCSNISACFRIKCRVGDLQPILKIAGIIKQKYTRDNEHGIRVIKRDHMKPQKIARLRKIFGSDELNFGPEIRYGGDRRASLRQPLKKHRRSGVGGRTKKRICNSRKTRK